MGLASMRRDKTTRMPVVSLSKSEQYPCRDRRGRVECCAGRYGGEEVRVYGGHAFGVPESRDYAEDDGDGCGGVFKTGTIVNGRWMLVDKEEADWRQSKELRRNVNLKIRRFAGNERRTTPAVVGERHLASQCVAITTH